VRVRAYRKYGWARYPQLFVGVKRAPLSVVPRLADLPGVIAVEPRIVRDVLVDWPSSPMPVSARMVSVTNAGDEMLSRLRPVRGSGPSRGSTHEALINAGFADAQASAQASTCASFSTDVSKFSRDRDRALGRVCLCSQIGAANPGRSLLRGPEYQMWSATFDPDNRLVARGLEAEWKNCLRELDKAKAEPRTAKHCGTLSPHERRRLLALGTDILKVWQAPTTLPRDKKELLRTVLEEVIISVDKERRCAHLTLR
jgi:hypothetical protein